MTPTHPGFMTREQLVLRVIELENQLTATRSHTNQAVGDVTAAVAQTAAAAERRRIAEQLRAEARRGSRKMAGPLRTAADLIEEQA